MNVVAIGGMGKSALTWVWLLKDVLGQELSGLVGEGSTDLSAVATSDRPEAVIWWSFYESQASFDAFLDEAVTYLGDGIDPKTISSKHDKAQVLLRLLRQRRALLVLDGFERELRAYAGLNAAYQGDAVGDLTRENFRGCVDPVVGAFLLDAASIPMQSRIVLTTRLLPVELEGLAGSRQMTLTALDLDSVAALFHAEGIDGTRSEVEDACGKWGYHPLAVRLLAGVILKDPERPGDVTVARDYDVSDDLVPREHNILKTAYDALSGHLQGLLSRLAAFRSPVPFDAIRAVAGIESQRKLKDALRELIDRGLLFPVEGQATPSGPVRHDMHPIIRRYAYDRLGGKEDVHAQLMDYFDAVPKPDEEKLEKLDDLAPTIELYHHTVRAGFYDQARGLYRGRLSSPLYFRFGAHQTCIELLRGLFPDGEDAPPRLKNEGDQAWTLNELANSYSLSGRPREAVRAFELANEIYERQGSKTGPAIGRVNLAGQLAQLGDLNPAEVSLRRSIELFREVEDESDEAVGHSELGRLLSLTGRFDEARTELDTAWGTFEEQGHVQSQVIVSSYRSLRALLMHRPTEAVRHARAAREIAARRVEEGKPNERDIIRTGWLLGASNVALAAELPDQNVRLRTEAETHLTDALIRCRRINMVEFEADILLVWAKWHRARGDATSARRVTGEALEIADRCEYRLQQADAHNMLARLALGGGDSAEARRHAEIARERALCDGPPDHTYKPALDQADKLLAELA